MSYSRFFEKIKLNIQCEILKKINGKFKGAFSIYLNTKQQNFYGLPDKEFITDDGRNIPIFKNYRYDVKAGWGYFPDFILLARLEAFGRLNLDESNFFRSAIGTRTILNPLSEVTGIAKNAAVRNKDLFIPSSFLSNKLPQFKIDLKNLNAQVHQFKISHERMLKRLAATEVANIPWGASVLEIGFISGGHSIFAFEQLGFKSIGVDNSYGGLVSDQMLPDYNKAALNSQVTLIRGDITTQLPLEAESLDMIFSASVLEHIPNLKDAFAEMYRLLKPGGVMIHNYAPYFSHDGAHALGIGDSPWAHVRMKRHEYKQYLSEMRPFEFEIANDWFANALNYVPQSEMQRLVSGAGFKIGLWMAKSSHKKWLNDLTPEIINECFMSNTMIGIDDLVSQSVSFVGIKE
ncbi:AdoMet_MTases domain containing protein [Candidatus Methylopumilus universalis]|uniref:class I SAM-dependent methyltransferase n=1 Tax=Candidatus Methylopumilus universalis TaxID=2588536 RepID=UPI003BEED0AE